MMSLHTECAQIIALSLNAKPDSEGVVEIEEVKELWDFATTIHSQVVMQVST